LITVNQSANLAQLISLIVSIPFAGVIRADEGISEHDKKYIKHRFTRAIGVVGEIIPNFPMLMLAWKVVQL
jgi:acyl-CoA reductase-like NAD-dependent aldehyde dehydrogenase